jgi:uncharacterized protein YjeT (DUF2065 family)
MNNSIKILIYAIGVAMFIEGVPYLLMPKKTKEMMRMVSEMSERSIRVVGGIFIIVGFLLLYFM